MLVAGVIASYGVIEYNVILIVGAMAISPDLLPITAVGVGLVDRRLRLASRAFVNAGDRDGVCKRSGHRVRVCAE